MWVYPVKPRFLFDIIMLDHGLYYSTSERATAYAQVKNQQYRN